jgi:hypothetical protein
VATIGARSSVSAQRCPHTLSDHSADEHPKNLVFGTRQRLSGKGTGSGVVVVLDPLIQTVTTTDDLIIQVADRRLSN